MITIAKLDGFLVLSEISQEELRHSIPPVESGPSDLDARLVKVKLKLKE